MDSVSPTSRSALSDPIRAIADPVVRDVQGRHGADARGDRMFAADIAAMLPDTCGDSTRGPSFPEDDQPRRTALATAGRAPEFIGSTLKTPKTITQTFRGPAMNSRLEFACPNVDVRDFREQDEVITMDLGCGEFKVSAVREWEDRDPGLGGSGAAGNHMGSIGRRVLVRTGDVYFTPHQLNELGRLMLEAAAEEI